MKYENSKRKEGTAAEFMYFIEAMVHSVSKVHCNYCLTL